MTLRTPNASPCSSTFLKWLSTTVRSALGSTPCTSISISLLSMPSNWSRTYPPTKYARPLLSDTVSANVLSDCLSALSITAFYQEKSPALAGRFSWRRGRDSNPRNHLRGSLDFESSPFDHSGTSPISRDCSSWEVPGQPFLVECSYG